LRCVGTARQVREEPGLRAAPWGDPARAASQ
jgi:hypothetical protein